MIADQEKEHNVTMPMDNAELGSYMEVDTQEHTLSLNAYVGYSVNEDCIVGKEVISSDDEDYTIVKSYFLTKLNHFVLEQIRKIEMCAQERRQQRR